MRGGQSGADLTLEMWLFEGGDEKGEECREGVVGGAEPRATWLHTNIRDPCTSALKGTGVEDREHTKSLRHTLQQSKGTFCVRAWIFECKHEYMLYFSMSLFLTG